MKLSERQLEALLLIDEGTTWDDGVVTRYWTPNERVKRYRDLRGDLVEAYVYGAGFVSALKALERKGLTKKQRFEHSYSITEAGRILVEKLRADAEAA